VKLSDTFHNFYRNYTTPGRSDAGVIGLLAPHRKHRCRAEYFFWFDNNDLKYHWDVVGTI
jgi:hypothetical protein